MMKSSIAYYTKKVFRVCRGCGIKATSENELELFVKRPHKPYGRDTICKKCCNEHKTKPKVKVDYLRICRVCGLKAKTNEDLKLFEKRNSALYGRANRCKFCSKKRYYKRGEGKWQRTFIKNLEKPILCYFCNKEIIKLLGLNGNAIVIHSLDGNHENWDIKNKVPVHNSCHLSFHSLGRKASKKTRIKMSISHKRRFSNEVSSEEQKKAFENVRRAGFISNIKRKRG